MCGSLRIGLVGCGRHGRVLSGALLQVPDVVPAACADANLVAAEQAVRECGYRASYPSYAEMLEREQLDGVIIATPHDQLRPITLAAIEAGRNVFVEKPMGLTAAEGREIAQAAAGAGIKLMVGYCLRYAQVRTMMKGLLDQGVVGEPSAVTAGKGCRQLDGWLAQKERGGGQMMFLGVHITDQLLWLLGRAADQVYAEMRWRPDTGSDETTMYSVRFSGNLTAHICCSQGVNYSFDYVEVMGPAGRIRSEWVTGRVEVQSDIIPAYNEPTIIAIKADRFWPMYIAELTEFASAIREGREPAITAQDGIRTLEVVDAVFESAESGRVVSLVGG